MISHVYCMEKCIISNGVVVFNRFHTSTPPPPFFGRGHEYRCLPLQVHFFNSFDGYSFTVTVSTLSFTCSFLRTVICHFYNYINFFFWKLIWNFGIKLSNLLTTQVMVLYLWQKFCMYESLETKIKIILISPTALPRRLVTNKQTRVRLYDIFRNICSFTPPWNIYGNVENFTSSCPVPSLSLSLTHSNKQTKFNYSWKIVWWND